ncbi:MAG TPA: ABC-F family ATP-binding cassette domain-containing protein [Myxococcales bacterium]|nr:ABC-F family ATP-binding cassette domain-containing protein [Myxococcales bacterium]
MTLLRAADVSLAHGSRTLFSGLTFTIEEGERVGLVGVNGSGKSTLMKILAGALRPDAGELQLRRGARVTYLPQEPEFPDQATVASELSVANQPLRQALDRHAEISSRLHAEPEERHGPLVEQLSQVADQIERLGGWDTEHRARTLLDRLGVKGWDRPIAELSGGLRKRVAIARALLSAPDLFLLDEPTNHLDAETTEWLEDALDDSPAALLLVTHDRYFLDDLVDRIVEIGPGGALTSYPGNYEAYRDQKLVALEESEVKQHKRERWIAQEVAWLRKGVEARRTKSKARIERARKLLAERGFVRPKVAELQLAPAPRGGDKLLEVRGVSKRFGDRAVLEGVSLIIQRGERVGFLGKNGAGKTTLLRILAGELSPDAGERVPGAHLRVAYYDQARAQLDPEQTVYEAAAAEDQVEIGGRAVALRDYLDDLLFPVPMQRQKVGALSGGERNRLLLARLFLQGANLLALDEPTNDLDLVTLNVLERLLLSFTGAVLLVTHDRYFLDKVATSIVALEGDGRVVQYPGNFEMYRRLKAQREAAAASAPAPAAAAAAPAPAPEPARARKPGKLSYKDQRELDGMEAAIEAAEREKAELEAALARPESYTQPERMAALAAALEATTARVARLYERWQALEEMAGGR